MYNYFAEYHGKAKKRIIAKVFLIIVLILIGSRNLEPSD